MGLPIAQLAGPSLERLLLSARGAKEEKVSRPAASQTQEVHARLPRDHCVAMWLEEEPLSGPTSWVQSAHDCRVERDSVWPQSEFWHHGGRAATNQVGKD